MTNIGSEISFLIIIINIINESTSMKVQRAETERIKSYMVEAEVTMKSSSE